MKKLNNKAMTITEVLLTLSMIMIIIVAIITLLANLRSTRKTNDEISVINDYKNVIIRTIEDDLIRSDTKQIKDCSKNYEDYIICKILVLDNEEKELLIDTGMKLIKYNNIKYKMPKNIELNTNSTYIKMDTDFLEINIPMYYKNKNIGINIIDPINL